MKINNGTSRDIIVVHNGIETVCLANSSVKVNADKIQIRSVDAKNNRSHFRIFRHTGRDNVKGHLTSFFPGFYNEYVTSVSACNNREINILRYDFMVNWIFICRIYLTKEKTDKEFSFISKKSKKLFTVFALSFALPTCVLTGGLALISLLGMILDFDWTLIVAALISLGLFLCFFFISKDLLSCRDLTKNHANILKKGKQVIITESNKRCISYMEESCNI